MQTGAMYFSQFPPIVRGNFLLEFKRSRGYDFIDSHLYNDYLPSASKLLLMAFTWNNSVLGFKYWSDIDDCILHYGFIPSCVCDDLPSLN